MEFTKELLVREIRGMRSSNAPLRIIFEGRGIKVDGRSSLTLNKEDCERYQISASLNLVGRIFICKFESRELSIYETGSQKGFANIEALQDDDLMICLLQSCEHTSFSLVHVRPPKKWEYIERTLELSTLVAGGSMVEMPCPYYKFFLQLTEEEYKECKQLSERSVFKVSFQLKSDSEE